MTDKEVLKIIKRKTTIPESGESFDYISMAYDRAIEIIEAYINSNPKTGAFAACNDYWPDYNDYLENFKLPNGKTAAIYLHGNCEIFAIALNNVFGYPIQYLTDTTRYAHTKDKLNTLVHAYCNANGTYIDVRGVTTDRKTLIEEFEDFFSTPAYIDTSAHGLRDKLFNGMNETEARQEIQIAVDFIRSHMDWYKI